MGSEIGCRFAFRFGITRNGPKGLLSARGATDTPSDTWREIVSVDLASGYTPHPRVVATPPTVDEMTAHRCNDIAAVRATHCPVSFSVVTTARFSL